MLQNAAMPSYTDNIMKRVAAYKTGKANII